MLHSLCYHHLNFKIMNIKKLKEIIATLPDEMEVVLQKDEIITNQNISNFATIPPILPHVNKFVLGIGGLKLDDEVIFYRKVSETLGEGYIASLKITSKKLLNHSPKISIEYPGGIF